MTPTLPPDIDPGPAEEAAAQAERAAARALLATLATAATAIAAGIGALLGYAHTLP